MIKNTLYRVQLFGVILVNLLIFWVAYKTASILNGDWVSLTKEWQHGIWPVIGSFITIAMNNFFDHEMKARIVFLRWTAPLPGARAFSAYIKRDPRIDIDRLQQKVGTFPVEPGKQNALWYSLYQTIKSLPEIVQVHKEYLLMRDWACISVLLFIVLMPLAFIMFSSTSTGLCLGGVLVVQYFFARNAAVNSSKRFITTVLAIKAAGA